MVTQQTGLLNLEIGELLLLAVHLHDERNNEDEEGRARDLGSLAGTPQNILAKRAVLEAILLDL